MSHDPPLDQLGDLARAAEAHALQEHGVSLDPRAIDGILRSEAGALDPERLESVALTYGAWLGAWIVRQRGGQWAGLSEPTAPRVRVGGILVCPLDAVRRRLKDPASPQLEVLLDRLDLQVRDYESGRSGTMTRNRKAWDGLSGDPRFSGGDDLPPDPEAALGAVDEWIREEGIGAGACCAWAGGRPAGAPACPGGGDRDGRGYQRAPAGSGPAGRPEAGRGAPHLE